MSHSGKRSLGFVKIALVGMLALAPSMADAARLGGGSSFGSRGARTQMAPPATSTAPSARPMERTTTPQASPSFAGRPAAPAPAGGLLSGGFGRGLLGGLLGAGLIGMFMGHGFGGGLGGIMSFLGLIVQVGLIAMLAMFAWRFFTRSRSAPAAAGYGAARTMSGGPAPANGMGSGLGSGMGGGFSGSAPQASVQTPLTLADADFSAFEKLLAEAQKLYSEEDLNGLRRIATEEMTYYFRDDIEAEKKKNHATRVSDVKLLQGDLSEAWREGSDEYATVAMRFSLIDLTLDRTTGRVIDGDPQKPVEATEIWTFLRSAGRGPDAWQVSAIQQS